MKVVILAGGGGSRLFPLSRVDLPKQFLSIAGQESFFVQTLKRALTLVEAKDIIIVTNEDYYFFVENELIICSAEKANIICEPISRNTAPAVVLAMKFTEEKLFTNGDELFCVLPSDHLIREIDKFKNSIEKACILAKENKLVTLGVVPVSPETGYGYIQAGKKFKDGYNMISFKEKPKLKVAIEYYQATNYYWNSGIYIFTFKIMMEELNSYQADIVNLCRNSYEKILIDFASMPNISIDYAVTEKSARGVIVPLESDWNDVGSWDAVASILSKDKKDNIFWGDVYALDCKNTMILGNEKLIAVIGVNNLNIIETPDAILIAKKGSSQKVKDLVEKLKEDGRKEISENLTTFRPWGSYTILAEGEGYKVKRIMVKPGHSLSYQMHYHRSEHWTVIAGIGKVILDDKVVYFKNNESTFIPVAAKHRLENPGQLPLEIIEVQNGKYLGEDDIVRFDDCYNRK